MNLRAKMTMPAQPSAPAGAWFRSADGRRFKLHFAWLLVAKAVLLAALYFLCIAPQPRVDTSAGAVRERILPASEHAEARQP